LYGRGREPERSDLAAVAPGCACMTVRRTARAVTQLYDETLPL